MSFSITSVEAKQESFEQDVATAVKTYKESSGLTFNDGAEDLIQVGQEVAVQIAAALGDKAQSFSVNISGHGNPGHGPAEGWANETLSVSVSVGSYAQDSSE